MSQSKVRSFNVDHSKITVGLYGFIGKLGIATFDLRMIAPNTGEFSLPVLHSMEHILVDYFKTVSIYQNEVISLCPGACSTMFYLELVPSFTMPVVSEILSAADYALECATLKKVPGASEKECGNYKSHDLEGAVKAITEYASVLRDNFDLAIKAEADAGADLITLDRNYGIFSKGYKINPTRYVKPDIEAVKRDIALSVADYNAIDIGYLLSKFHDEDFNSDTLVIQGDKQDLVGLAAALGVAQEPYSVEGKSRLSWTDKELSDNLRALVMPSDKVLSLGLFLGAIASGDVKFENDRLVSIEFTVRSKRLSELLKKVLQTEISFQFIDKGPFTNFKISDISALMVVKRLLSGNLRPLYNNFILLRSCRF